MSPRRVRRRTGNLPWELTGFVGRRRETALLRQLLTSARLVTLTGAGGVGKTRLALRVAGELHRGYADGIWVADLAQVENTSLIGQTIAASLDLRNQSGQDAVDALGEFLQERQLLLVLDNCEHLTEETAGVVHTLLRRAPELQVIATSRQSLGITGEHVFSVPPLSTPPLDGELPFAEFSRYESVQLLVERCAAVAPAFAVSDRNREAVAQLCARLDGIPLAIELAAARMRTLTVEQIAGRIDDLCSLLDHGNRGAQERQQTLSTLLDWSFDMCTPAERTVWARASVFAGGCDLRAAEEICGGREVATGSVLELLSPLIEKSILSRVSDKTPVRYRLLEPIRQYGRRHLVASGQEGRLRRRHRDYYRELVEQAEQECFGPGQLEWLTRLQDENANIRAALDYSVNGGTADGEPGDGDDGSGGVAIAGALRVYWHSTGWLSEGRWWLERALTRYRQPDAVRAKALWTHGWLGLMQGHTTAVLPVLEEGRELAGRTGDSGLGNLFTLAFGVAEMYAGRLESADALLTSAYRGCRLDGDLVGTGIALIQSSLLGCLREDFDQAAACAAELVRTAERHGESWYRAHGHWVLGLTCWRRGDLATATAELQESIRLMRDFEERLIIARSFEVMGWVAAQREDPERACRLLGMAGRQWQDTSATFSAFGRLSPHHDIAAEQLRAQLGEVACRAGQRAGAAVSLQQAIAYALGEPDPAATAATGGARPGEAVPLPLTRREVEIASLIAIGRTNREIAAELVISVRTVEAHVEHVLNKSGFTSRTQIAAWVATSAPAASSGPQRGESSTALLRNRPSSR